jgi:hypothetical protein
LILILIVSCCSRGCGEQNKDPESAAC